MLDMLPLRAVKKNRPGPPGRPARPPGRPPGPGRGEKLNKYKKDWLSIQQFFVFAAQRILETTPVFQNSTWNNTCRQDWKLVFPFSAPAYGIGVRGPWT